MWAESQFLQLAIAVSGIQHFSKQDSKNAADIAMAIDAVTDFLLGTTRFIVVMSDDSDFMALYVKLKEMTQSRPPFLWVMTDRDNTRSATIREFFPNDHIHVVSFHAKTRTQLKSPARTLKGVREGSGQFAEMANLIITKIPIGTFKSTVCQSIIKERWPKHPISSMSAARFGAEFAAKIWPILEGQGVRLQKKQPRKYEMTEEAKPTIKSDKTDASA